MKLEDLNPRSETALRLLSDKARNEKFLVGLENALSRYPIGRPRDTLQQRLGSQANEQFRGATWELFWFETVYALDPAVTVEVSESGNVKTVDLVSPRLNLAVEVSSISELNSELSLAYWESDLHTLLDSALHHVGVFLSLQVVRSGDELPDHRDVGAAVTEWVFRELWPKEGGTQGHFRLQFHDLDFVIDFSAVRMTSDLGAVCSLKGFGPDDTAERIRQRLEDKAKKKSAVPDRPLLLAIADPLQLFGAPRFSRLNALMGDDILLISTNGEATPARRANGFLLGDGDWRNSDVSAVAFTTGHLPDFGSSSIEIWVNGRARHPLDIEPWFPRASIIAQRGEGLQERPAGVRTSWREVALH